MHNQIKKILRLIPAPLRQKFWETNHIIRWKTGHYLSLYNRDKNIQNYLNSHKTRKLQVGCWPYLRKGWINSELYGSSELIPINLLKKLPLPDNSIDYIFSEHVHEHFTLEEGQKMLSEFYRVLKKNGKIRIATPDLRFLIQLYNSKKSTLQKEYIKWSATEFVTTGSHTDTFVINNFVRAWGHDFIYDFKSLKWCLKQTGFANITQLKPGISTDNNLKNLESHWKSTSKEFNNLETLVVEAQKI